MQKFGDNTRIKGLTAEEEAGIKHALFLFNATELEKPAGRKKSTTR